MNASDIITDILCEILDLDPSEVRPETYVIRTLQAESIDLLEIGVGMQHRLHIDVDDDVLFLKNARIVLARAEKSGMPPSDALQAEYPHLSPARVQAILADLPAGPVLLVADLIAYAKHAGTGARE